MRYSLRQLFCVVGLIAAASGVAGHFARCQSTEIAWQQVGGIVLDRDVFGRPTAVSISGAQHSERPGLPPLVHSVPKLQKLYVSDVVISKTDAVWIGSLQELTYLSLDGCSFRQGSVQRLAELRSLRLLSLKHTNVADNDLAKLTLLSQLETLYLDSTSVTDEGLQHLKEFSRLEILSLRGLSVGDQGVDHLRQLSSLIYLDLTGTSTSDRRKALLPDEMPSVRLGSPGDVLMWK